MTKKQETTTSDQSANPPQKSIGMRLAKVSVICLLLVVLLVLFLPQILARTPVGKQLLSRALQKNQIEGEIGRANLGWFQAASLSNIRLADEMDRWRLHADQAATELTLWQLIFSQGDLGEFRIVRPVLTIDPRGNWQDLKSDTKDLPDDRSTARKPQRLRVVVEDAKLLTITENGEESEFASGVTVAVEYQQTETEGLVQIDPGTPLDHVQLTPEMCDTALKFAVPILSQTTWTDGALSLKIDECRIPLDRPNESTVHGELTIHSVRSGLKDSMVRDLVRGGGELLIARLNRRRAEGDELELPSSVKLADESVIEFEVRDGAVTHRGLSFGLPEVAPDLVITTEGTVRFDSQLDLVATIPVGGSFLGDGLLSKLTQGKNLQVPIRGSLEQPQVSLEGQEELLGGMLEGLLQPRGDGAETEASDINAEEVVGQVLEGLQQLRDSRQRRRAEREAAESSETDADEERASGLFRRLRERRQAPE